jgi:transcriptional regulator with XRE-family HTH domain
MNRSISKPSRRLSKGNALLSNLLNTDTRLVDELDDARVCNDISIDLYNLRCSVGLTQKELAEKIGVKQSNISRWEQVGYQGYKVKMLNKIVRVLGGRLSITISQPVVNYMTRLTMATADYITTYNELTGVTSSVTNPRWMSVEMIPIKSEEYSHVVR